MNGTTYTGLPGTARDRDFCFRVKAEVWPTPHSGFPALLLLAERPAGDRLVAALDAGAVLEPREALLEQQLLGQGLARRPPKHMLLSS